MTGQPHIILASGSPRRRDLLEQIGIVCTIHPSNLEEGNRQNLPPEQYAQLLAEEKARTVSREYTDALIIGADTIVVHNDRTLEKPADETEAKNMLTHLSGDTHQVITGYAILNTRTDELTSGTVTSAVTFHSLTESEIEAYIATGEPMDKAGAYGIQGRAAVFVDRIEGDYFAVVGLPLTRIAEGLRQHGVDIFADVDNREAKL